MKARRVCAPSTPLLLCVVLVAGIGEDIMWKCIVIQYQSRCVVPSTVVGTVMTLCGVHLLMQATVTCRDTQTVQTHNKHQQVRVDVATQMVRTRSILDDGL